MSFILLSGLLIYMIFLSNEMSKICDRLLGRTKRLMKKIDKITKSGYSDVFRKNNDNTRSLLSVKEQGNTIKQIILHNSNGSNNSLLYLKGNFDHIVENKHVFSETGGLQGPFPSPDKPNVFCIKTSKYKLMYFKTPNEWKMFDLENDPFEKNNIYGKITDVQELLKEQLLSWINR